MIMGSGVILKDLDLHLAIKTEEGWHGRCWLPSLVHQDASPSCRTA